MQKKKRDCFIEYQTNTYKNLERMANSSEKWSIVNLEDYNIDECANIVKKVILEKM